MPSKYRSIQIYYHAIPLPILDGKRVIQYDTKLETVHDVIPCSQACSVITINTELAFFVYVSYPEDVA